MGDDLILLGNEPRAYREAMAAALGALRPALAVRAVEAARLDAEVARRRPRLVVCSRLTDAVRTRAGAWVLLYPDGARLVASRVAGEEALGADLGLAELVAIADRAVRSAA